MIHTHMIEPVPPEQAAARFLKLATLCQRIAGDINVARVVLRDGAENADTAYLVADVLDRIGWMADQASVVAGAKYPVVCGDADGWMLDGLLAQEAA
jgi:hypothetical protein